MTGKVDSGLFLDKNAQNEAYAIANEFVGNTGVAKDYSGMMDAGGKYSTGNAQSLRKLKKHHIFQLTIRNRQSSFILADGRGLEAISNSYDSIRQ